MVGVAFLFGVNQQRVGYDGETRDPQRDGTCTREPAPAPGTHRSPLGGGFCGAGFGRAPARGGVSGNVTAKGPPHRCWQLSPGAHQPEPRAAEPCGDPATAGVTARPCVGVTVLGIGVASPLLSVPYFDIFLKKRQKEEKEKKKTEKSG